ncbi:hypothetical protein LSH36_33g08077 [Paralvinella palmiformis]|uniref:SET domain-containing protein n=1 Tax=Paralvinella palmiformis TaxID=53620 RepID=A0AAD9NH47_9ANNE|nr:hypothetical protein LSH36_33g08077 [Paralvinella palmiformis]
MFLNENRCCHGINIEANIWSQVVLMLSWLMTSSGYAPDETECPDKLHRGIMSHDYWVLYLRWLGVFATTFIPKNTWIGEYEGDILPSQLGDDNNFLEYAWSVPYGAPYRAWRTLPWRYFVIKPSKIPNAGLGVFATTFIPKNTWIGEYEGDILPSPLDDSDFLEYGWGAYADDEDMLRIDGGHIERSNWLRFVNCPNRESDESITGHFCYGRVFYRTKCDIYPGKELLIYYGDSYVEELGIYDGYYGN